MRRFWAWVAAWVALLVVAMAVTVRSPLGATLWHYNAAFVAALVGALLAWPLLKHRRYATLAMAFAGVVATASGFAMLYTTDFPFKEWVTWWHSVSSFAFMLAFLTHWLHNKTRLWSFTARLAARERRAGLVVAVGWVAVGALAMWTWGAPTNARFTRDNYLYLSSWVVLAGVAVAYGAWLVHRAPRLHTRLDETAYRNRLRAIGDTSLFVWNWGALLTGFALLYFAEPLRAGDLKYVSKWWHTATSVALLACVALHVGFNARLVASHAGRIGRG